MARSSKGPSFERQFCKQLSLWWTQDLKEPRDDIFWRTAGSGARAKTRGRKLQRTDYQHGDITATDPVGIDLIRVITIEAKRGYNKFTFADLIDKPKITVPQQYEHWLSQTIESCEQSNSFSYMMVVKRDRRLPIVILTDVLMSTLKGVGGFSEYEPLTEVRMSCEFNGDIHLLWIIRLRDFFMGIHPDHIRKIAEGYLE